MHHVFDDCAKRRLVERVDIMTAVEILRSKGFDQDSLIREITKLFYVDLDEYNQVVRTS